ncbi:class I SAM-dependent methyltransferase [Helicobacter sp. MIT 03-1614]|uniref:class I SAM-dependent methyltransferase n=1 Tax=Helicobacter sp. MIT 03-1614 TaxID=1548147 RepID=UPI0009DE518D|nr:class I SAM-dependent methyltransferase [Helicobacter sp. MIT 03-1614]TLD87150.1 class I SAM-dependent methyltransferase [Helicobacter sp. MIT 03-1614]
MNLNVVNLGQVFTPPHIVSDMLALIQSTKKLSNPRFLEPSCGNGAFFQNLPKNKVGIEIDSGVVCDKAILQEDFFAYSTNEKFDCIIGNPPYVRYQDIAISTKDLLKSYSKLFDSRSNLYLFFIYKCILHLKEGGELIFITPRDFLKSTSSVRLNEFLFHQGSITHFIDLGDKKIFDNAQPNCAIWRFEKDNFTRKTQCLREFSCINGQLLFTKKAYTIPFKDLFFVKVGAVSGADSIFANEKWGNMDFVCSQSAKSGKTRKMIYGIYGKDCAYLQDFKEQLLRRRIKKFNELNWWEWGRDYYKSENPRIYVNTKTRNKTPFFLHPCNVYDGSVLAVFPKFKVDSIRLGILCERLNNVDWEELGFVCDGRFLFSQRSLENAVLDSSFLEFANDRIINEVDGINRV